MFRNFHRLSSQDQFSRSCRWSVPRCIMMPKVHGSRIPLPPFFFFPARRCGQRKKIVSAALPAARRIVARLAALCMVVLLRLPRIPFFVAVLAQPGSDGIAFKTGQCCIQ